MYIRPVFILLIAMLSQVSAAQEKGFPFGQVTYKQLEMTAYEKDSSAAAVVLNEFGEAFFSSEEPFNLIFRYHVLIKILNKNGLDHANVEIPLWKQDGKEDFLASLEAASYGMENGSMKQTLLDPKKVFTENVGKRVNVKKFAVPAVREGSVIEYAYEIQSPFRFNFRPWYFQSDIPKINSEYWALIPGNYVYNIALRGYLKLQLVENTLVKDCFRPGGRSADCVQYKWGMTDIPAFVEEEYMTARSNFLSAISFELAEIKYFDGRTDEVTKEWKDAELELRKHPDFGPQLRKGKDLIDKHPELLAETDPLERAKAIYAFVQRWFQWNDNYGMLTEHGVRKAYETRQGNVADINLSLVAALREAGLNADPVILSTRRNGVPGELYPVLSEFNYVVASVSLGGRNFLADASDRLHPFGMLPERCLNGKGRVMDDDGSFWVSLAPNEKAKQISVADLKLDNEGVMRGTIQTTYIGYEAVAARRRLFAHDDEAAYIAELDAKLSNTVITGHEIRNPDDIEKPLIQTLQVEFRAFDDMDSDQLLLNPNLLRKWDANPFKSSERVYPVDFGMAVDVTSVVTVEIPAGFEILHAPGNAALALPNQGGRYYFDFKQLGDRIVVSNSLLLNKAAYSPVEYHYLKELFASMLQKQNEDLVFRRKI